MTKQTDGTANQQDETTINCHGKHSKYTIDEMVWLMCETTLENVLYTCKQQQQLLRW